MQLSKSIMLVVKTEIANNPGALVAVIDPDGVFQFLSPTLKGLLGYEPADEVGHNLAEYFPPDEASHFMLTIQDALLNGQSVPTTRARPLTGGGVRRMRGVMRKLVDKEAGREYVISVARPVS
jgi:PAS domain S-box-containing protein